MEFFNTNFLLEFMNLLTILDKMNDTVMQENEQLGEISFKHVKIASFSARPRPRR